MGLGTFDPEHKVVLARVVGERKQPSANKLLKRVRERGLVPEDRPARQAAVPAMVPDDCLSYAQVIKHHRNGHLVEVGEKDIFEEYAGRASILTAFVERCNLTILQENKRLTRKTLAFSKRTYRLDAHMMFYFASYNFCRPHGSLRHPDASGKMRKWTPMRELGITDRNWSIKGLLTFPYPKTSV